MKEEDINLPRAPPNSPASEEEEDAYVENSYTSTSQATVGEAAPEDVLNKVLKIPISELLAVINEFPPMYHPMFMFIVQQHLQYQHDILEELKEMEGATENGEEDDNVNESDNANEGDVALGIHFQDLLINIPDLLSLISEFPSRYHHLFIHLLQRHIHPQTFEQLVKIENGGEDNNSNEDHEA